VPHNTQQEAELASKEKKFAYELGQTKESARAAYDAVRMEREELRLDLAKAEEREKAMQSEIEHVKALAQTFAAKADDLGTQLQISEKHRMRLESGTLIAEKLLLYALAAYRVEYADATDMDKKDRESEQAIYELKKDIESVREQFEKAHTQLETTTAQFEGELTSHKASRERLRESEVCDDCCSSFCCVMATECQASASLHKCAANGRGAVAAARQDGGQGLGGD
jgi:asparagine synthetase B (glutamine-hydrolysing)